MADNTSQKATKSSEKNKYPNAINRTTSESLRVGDSDKVISHPTTLSSGTANSKKKTSFQITSVTVGSRISNDGGDDSADDLDESHTDDISDVVDISRVTDIENETPSYSEDTFSKDDVFFNTSASLGSAPVIPTSSQYGLAIVANENCVNSSATCANNISGNELHVNVADNVINLVGVKHNENEMRDLHSHSGRNERFKVVKIESTEPFRRGRWMCMDYLDHSMVQQQQSQSNISNTTAKENDVQNVNAQHTATDSGISVTDVPPPVNTVDEQVPSNLDKGTQDHQQYTMNPNAGQTAPGGYPSVSPGQATQPQQPQVIQQHAQSVSLNTPMQQNMLNNSQHQSLQAQQMQQVMANAGIPVQMSQQPPQQMQSQPITQMQPHIQQQPQQTTTQQVPVSQQMPPPQQVQMQPAQTMPQIAPQHIPQQQMHTMQMSNQQQMQVSQQMMQQIQQQSLPTQMQPQPYPQQAQQPLQQHIQQPMHQMSPSLQPTMTQNQQSPQTYQQTTMQQCPPGLSPQQMMSVQQHQLPPQPQYSYATPQGIPLMTPQGQQQGQMMAAPNQQGQIITAQGQQGQVIPPQAQQGQMMTSQGQLISMPTQMPHQTSVPVQQAYSVTSMPPQQQSQPQQQQQPPPQQQPQPPPPQQSQQQQQQQPQMSIGHSTSMHHVPTASVATSMAGYAPAVTGQSIPAVVTQPNQPAPVAAASSSQTTPTVIPQQCYMMPQSSGQQTLYANSSVPASVVEAITSDAVVMEQVVQTAALLDSLTEVTAAPDDAPPAGEETESTSGTSAVAIDNKIEQAMDLVKSHLMFAVREEVEVLKEKIAELMDRINHLEVENTILKANASQETLAQLSSLPAPPSSNNAP